MEGAEGPELCRYGERLKVVRVAEGLARRTSVRVETEEAGKETRVESKREKGDRLTSQETRLSARTLGSVHPQAFSRQQLRNKGEQRRRQRGRVQSSLGSHRR